MTSPPFADIAAWPPTRYTPPLSDDFPSAFDRFAKVFQIIWTIAFGYALEAWQVSLIRAILEVYPAGHPRAGQLRYRQVVISLGRQNGKTEIAAALGLWRLLSKVGALVIGIASSAEQARLVYDRTMAAITRNADLAERFDRLTETRGIRALDGGRYEIKAAKSAALQGLPIDLGIVDELHLLKRALWSDLVNGTGGRPNCLVAGITTAGDVESELLIDLYRLGDEAVDDEETRVGFFVWEAPEARVPEDDETLGRWLALANPSVASGRMDLETVIADVRTLSKPEIIRYRLNRFVDSVRHPFIEFSHWLDAQRAEGETLPSGRVVFTFDRTPDWAYGTVTATVCDSEGVVWSEIAASVVNPSLERFVRIAEQLARHAPAMFAMDAYTLRGLGNELKKRGLPVHLGTQADAFTAAARLHRLILTKKFRHAGDPLLAQQIPRAITKTVGENFRISRADSSVEIDAVLATALGVAVAEALPKESGPQIF